MIDKASSYLIHELKNSMIGAVRKRIENAVRERVITLVTVINPDPTINDIAIPCNSCPYLKRNGTCDFKCSSWYPLLAEKIVYNSLPEQEKLRAQIKHLKKQCKDLGAD